MNLLFSEAEQLRPGDVVHTSRTTRGRVCWMQNSSRTWNTNGLSRGCVTSGSPARQRHRSQGIRSLRLHYDSRRQLETVAYQHASFNSARLATHVQDVWQRRCTRKGTRPVHKHHEPVGNNPHLNHKSLRRGMIRPTCSRHMLQSNLLFCPAEVCKSQLCLQPVLD